MLGREDYRLKRQLLDDLKPLKCYGLARNHAHTQPVTG
jgi:hypothetical protein